MWTIIGSHGNGMLEFFPNVDDDNDDDGDGMKGKSRISLKPHTYAHKRKS
jgi:hypothetical protein